MRALVVAVGLAVLATTACGSSEDTTDAGRSPAPRVAPSEDPEDEFDEAPRPAAGPPDAADKAGAKICNGLGEVDDAESPAAALRSLATKAKQDGVQFHRVLTLLHRAYVKGDVDKAQSYIDRLSTFCEELTGRRNF